MLSRGKQITKLYVKYTAIYHLSYKKNKDVDIYKLLKAHS